MEIPSFLFLILKDNACVWRSEKEWIREAFWLFRLATVSAVIVLMAGLYSRIVYTLWFKNDPGNQLTFQQRVSIKLEQAQYGNSFFRFTEDYC